MKEILLIDIPEEGLEIAADEGEPWFGGVLRDALGEAFTAEDRARLAVRILLIEGNVTIEGTIALSQHPTCDRCLVPYREESEIPLHVTLAPLYENRRQQELLQQEEVELVREDLDFAFFEGDRFDLDEVVREQLITAQPMKRLCSESCKGLCQRCGKNWNEGPCDCREEGGDPRWAALKDFTPKAEKH